MSVRSLRAVVVVLFVLVPLPGPFAARSAPAGRRPLSHRDYDAWRDIGAPVLSRDGRLLAYSYMPQDGDGDLVIRDLRTGAERRVGVGDIPAPGEDADDELGPDQAPPVRRIRISLTSDGAFVVATAYPSRAEAERARKEKKTAQGPRAGLVVVDTRSGATTRVEGVKSAQVPAQGGAWLAYLKEGPPRDKDDDKAARKPAGEPRRRGTGRRGRNRDAVGTDLVLRDLAQGRERTFAHVLEYSFARDGKTLVYAVSSPVKEENGVYALAPGSARPPAPLLAGEGRYRHLAWDRRQGQAAFLSDRDDARAKVPRLKVYLWQRGAPATTEVVSAATPGFPASLVISEEAGPSFSRDGKRLFVAAGPPRKPEPEPAPDDEDDPQAVKADLWHWKDDIVQPMQRVRAGQERDRTYRGVYHLAEKRYIQLADPVVRTAIASDDGLRAIALDDHAYRRLVDYDGNYSDVYLVDASSGARTLALKQLRGGGLQWAPDGKHAVYYQDRHWRVLDAEAQTPTTRNLTDKLPVSFSNERHDTPGPPPSYGGAGWAKDGRSFLAYDRYDVWQLFVDGRPARNLTGGQGRRSHLELRVERIEPREEDDEVDRGLDVDRPLTLRAVDEDTRASGFYRSAPGGGPLQRLLWGDHRYRFLGRAHDADLLLVSASRFDQYPDLYTTDASFHRLTRVTNGAAQMAPFRWGTAELVSYKSADGVPLRAVLYKPEGFDPHKKYPMLLSIYERLSQTLHNFHQPRPGNNVNISYYVSNGYLVLTPDIVYTVGHPGPSALKCVLPAIQAVVDRGFVDEKAIGIQGHSWGGYQVAYLVTQTNRFRAAEAGAPVANMTSAYSGIRWGSGQPRQWQYEQAQSRMARLLYEAPLEYLENSPVFHIQSVQTPLLILHNDGDTAVPWYQGIELFLALRRTGKEAYLWSYNGEPHGLRRRPDQKDFTVRMQQFFDHYLKNAPAPAWMTKGVPYLERDEEKQRFRDSFVN